jgi:hypothetical protein
LCSQNKSLLGPGFYREHFVVLTRSETFLNTEKEERSLLRSSLISSIGQDCAPASKYFHYILFELFLTNS